MKAENLRKKHAARDTLKNRHRNAHYGVQVRQYVHGEWAWIKPNGQATLKPVEAASWAGVLGEVAALEAAKTLSVRNPGLSFRTGRF